jgi:hypothetical protein
MNDTPKREPLLSDASITVLAKSSYDYTLCWLAMEKARTHYENLIDTGVLMVVKEVKMYSDGDMGEDAQTCPECDYQYYYSDKLKIGEFCRCGSKIIE